MVCVCVCVCVCTREREREAYPKGCTEHKDHRDQEGDNTDYLYRCPYYIGSVKKLLGLTDGPNQEEGTA